MSFQLAPKTFWWAELISQFFFNLNSSKNFTCLSGKLSSKFTSLIAKFPSPGLSDTTCFARWSVVLILCYSQVRYIFQPCLHSHSLFYARGTCPLISRSLYIITHLVLLPGVFSNCADQFQGRSHTEFVDFHISVNALEHDALKTEQVKSEGVALRIGMLKLL